MAKERSNARRSSRSRSRDTKKKKFGSSGERRRWERERSLARRERQRRKERKEKKKRDRDRAKDTPHFEWEAGMALGEEGRFVAQKQLGEGTFGRVLECVDITAPKSSQAARVAVKVVKGVRRYCEHAECEAEVLLEIKRRDPDRRSRCVRILDTFLHPKRHFCIVLEPLDTSIRDFLKDNDSNGLFLSDAQEVSRQLLEALSFLHRNEITHTDLKCRNVMFRSGSHYVAPHPRKKGLDCRRPRCCDVVIVDFGGAVFDSERHGGRIGTRQFRAPEVVLGLAWDESSDMWSAGCIVSMLYTGVRPFSVHEDGEHCAMMERLLCSEIPSSMAMTASDEGSLPEGVAFDSKGRLMWPSIAPDRRAVERVSSLRPLREALGGHTSFWKVVKGLLRIDPDIRLTAKEALEEAFFAAGEQVVE